MVKGTVKWFNATKGYGFITPDEGDKDVFVHVSEVQKSGMDTLNEEQRIAFEIVESRGKNAAANLEPVDE